MKKSLTNPIDSASKKRSNTTPQNEWQLAEIQAGIAELDAGNGVPHDKVVQWLSSWGKPDETKAP